MSLYRRPLTAVFFARPGYTLGRHPARVGSQASDGYPEDVTYTRANVRFAALHIVGSASRDRLESTTTSGSPPTLATKVS